MVSLVGLGSIVDPTKQYRREVDFFDAAGSLMGLLRVLERREAGGVRVNASLGLLSQGQELIEQR